MSGNSSVPLPQINVANGDFQEVTSDKASIKDFTVTSSDKTFYPHTGDNHTVVGKFTDIELHPTESAAVAQYTLVDCLQKYDTFIDNYQDWLSAAADANGHIQLSGATSEIAVDHITCANVDVPGLIRIGQYDTTGAALSDNFAQLEMTGNTVKLYNPGVGNTSIPLYVDDLYFKLNGEYVSLSAKIASAFDPNNPDSATLAGLVVQAILENEELTDMLMGALTRASNGG